MSEMPTVRTRFAPSPTGPLHIGGARSALFSWLLARRYGGQFILRLEDTDRKRFVPGSEEEINEDLRWLGLDWDEGPDIGGLNAPYRQSERRANYREISDLLIKRGAAYPCFCSTERLAAVNEERRRRGEAGGYDRHCRNLAASEAAQRMAAGESHVIRLRAPRHGQTETRDMIRGALVYENERLQDAVLLKSDGFPTYHLAVVADDRAMRISHVTRAVEWLATFPMHVLLWRALGWQEPQFAHLPVLLNPNGKGKLSKRHARFQQDGQMVPVLVREFRAAGYHGPAVANFLTNIGWSFGDDREVFSLQEAAQRFDIARVNPANSAFPFDKLRWLNGLYIRDRIAEEELTNSLRLPLENAGYSVDETRLRQVVPLVSPRIKTFAEVVPMAGFFFAKDFRAPPASQLIPKKQTAETTVAMLNASRELIRGNEEFSAESLQARFAELATRLGVKRGPLYGAARVAITGSAVSPPVFESMAILGREEVLRRMDMALAALAAEPR